MAGPFIAGPVWQSKPSASADPPGLERGHRTLANVKKQLAIDFDPKHAFKIGL
jgi:hypothetical protein